MMKRDDTVRFSAEQLAAMRHRSESRTDWARVDAMTEAELETSIAADPDDVDEAPDWTQAVVGLPPRKEHINIRIDADVLSWFKQTGRGWQTRMNNVVRAFVQSRRHTGSGWTEYATRHPDWRVVEKVKREPRGMSISSNSSCPEVIRATTKPAIINFWLPRERGSPGRAR